MPLKRHLSGSPTEIAYSALFEDIHVAKQWGITPDVFWDKEPEVQVLMKQYIRTTNLLQAVLAEKQRSEARRNKAPSVPMRSKKR